MESLIDHPRCKGCPQQVDTSSGCKVVEAGAEVALDAFLERQQCFLKDHLLRFATAYLAHRPRSLLEPEDLVQEVFGRLLRDPALRRGGFGRGLGAFLAYLRTTAARSAISGERRERGRIRCGNCKHLAPYSGLCLKPGHEYTHVRQELSQDPRALEPACREFLARREQRSLESWTEPARDLGDDPSVASTTELIDAVHQALLALAEAHPRAALVVRGRLLDGKTYDALSQVGASVRTMKRDFAFGMEYLRRKLGRFQVDFLAPRRAASRSERRENA